MELILRDYQQDLLTRIYHSMLAGHKRPLVVAPCGSGKTILLAELSRLTQKQGNRVVILVHRRELYHQTVRTLATAGVDSDEVEVHMAQTYSRHLVGAQKPNLIITDEAHMAAAKTWQRIYEFWPDVFVVGFSASPCRLDGKPLGDTFDDLIVGVDTRDLIDRGFLADYKYYGVTVADLTGVPMKGRDFDMESAEQAMIKRAVFGDVIRHYRELADGLRTVVYCTTVSHSQRTAEAFRGAGYRAEHIDGTYSSTQRDAIIERFRTGETEILTNCDIVSTGFDLPAIECCIMLRPTMSTALYIQQSGRALRPLDGKTAIIIDAVGNHARHGLPDDPRGWSLTDTVKPTAKFTEQGELILRTCLSCYAVYPNTLTECPLCGAAYESTREEIQQIESVRLEEIKRRQETRKQDWNEKRTSEIGTLADCRTYNDLILFAKKTGEPDARKFATRESYRLGIARPWERSRRT